MPATRELSQHRRTYLVAFALVMVGGACLLLRDVRLTLVLPPTETERQAQLALEFLRSNGASLYDGGWNPASDANSVERVFLNYPIPLDPKLMAAVSKLENLRLLSVTYEVSVGWSLQRCGVGDAELAQIASLQHLEEVYVDGSVVTDAGLLELADNPTIRYVGVNGTQVTKAGVAAFKKRRPDCHVWWNNHGSYNRKHGVYWCVPTPTSLCAAQDLPYVTRIEPDRDFVGSRIDVRQGDLRVLSNLPDLEHVYLGGIAQITDAAVDELVGLPSIKSINIAKTSMTKKGADRLKDWYRKRGHDVNVIH